MVRKFAVRVCAALLCLGGTVWGQEIDLADDQETFPINVTGDTYLYSSDGSVVVNTSAERITINSGNLVIGHDSSNDGLGFTLKAGTFSLDHMSSLVIESPSNNGNMTLDISVNASDGGTVVFGGGGTGRVSVFGAALSLGGGGAGPANVTFKDNSTTYFTSVANSGRIGDTNAANMYLEGGSVGFGTSLRLANGIIDVTKDSIFAVNGRLTLNHDSDQTKAVLKIGTGVKFSLLKDMNDPNALASLVVGGTGGGTLEMDYDSSVLNVDKLTFAKNAVLTGAGGALNANSLEVAADFTDSHAIKTKVSGMSTIKKGATYTVKGTNNTYLGGMHVQGTLQGDTASTAIELGTGPGDLKGMQVDGGFITAGPGGLAINYADITVTKATPPGDASNPSPAKATIDATAGALDLSTSTLTIRLPQPQPAATIVANNGITVSQYRQYTGDVLLSTAAPAGKMVVTGGSVIGGAEAVRQVNLDVLGNAAHFAGGLTLDRFGSVTATRADGGVDVGSNAMSGISINANGNNQLYAGSGQILTFRSQAAGPASMMWNGEGNSVYGAVDQTAFGVTVGGAGKLMVATGNAPVPVPGIYGYGVGSMTIHGEVGLGSLSHPGGTATGVIQSMGNVIVKGGGLLTADYSSPARVVNINQDPASRNVLRVEAGGMLRANTATIRAENFRSVDINGTFVAGLLDGTSTPANAARLIANSDINISSTGLVTMTVDLAKVVTASENVNGATRLMEIDNSAGTAFKITNKANMSSKSMLGFFDYALNANQTILYVKEAMGQLTLDGSEEDRRQALENLRYMWGKNQIKKDLANIIYDVVTGEIVAEPEDSIAGNKNLAIFNALAAPEGQVVGIDTLEYVNGAFMYGITDVAMETTRTYLSDVTNRAKTLACSFVASADVSGQDAYASTAMHPVLKNRFWLGGTANRQHTKADQDFSGYKYKSTGFVGGYDRAWFQNVAVGASFAYSKGDYKDLGAAAHDSDIESFSAGAYATYANPCGWFLTGHLGYTYSQNDIRELRRDPYARRLAWHTSSFHTNTWSLGALLGYDLRLRDSGFVMSPSVGLNYIVADSSDHKSKLDGVATQRITEARNSAVYVPVDLTLQYDLCIGYESRLRLELNGGYSYNFRDKGMNGRIAYFDLSPESSIEMHGRSNVKHSYKAGGGFRYSYRTFDAGLRYDYIRRASSTAHRLMATAGVSF